jgi:hypothetical protein
VGRLVEKSSGSSSPHRSSRRAETPRSGSTCSASPSTDTDPSSSDGSPSVPDRVPSAGRGDTPRVEADGEGVLLHVGTESYRLDRRAAAGLRSSLGEALSGRHEFLRTVGEHREDGSYVVSRRGAESSGHRKVFDSFAALERLYERLPAEFTARDVAGNGLTGSRRHVLVHHLVEHPAFDCELVSRQPLTGRKTDEG